MVVGAVMPFYRFTLMLLLLLGQVPSDLAAFHSPYHLSETGAMLHRVQTTIKCMRPERLPQCRPVPCTSTQIRPWPYTRSRCIVQMSSQPGDTGPNGGRDENAAANEQAVDANKNNMEQAPGTKKPSVRAPFALV
jgi:hypothetical protein